MDFVRYHWYDLGVLSGIGMLRYYRANHAPKVPYCQLSRIASSSVRRVLLSGRPPEYYELSRS